MIVPEKTADYCELQNTLAKVVPFLASFLDSSSLVHLAILESDGTIRFANRALLKCLKVDFGEMIGRNISDFLTGPDGELLSKRLTDPYHISPGEELLLNFVDVDQIPHSLRFRYASIDGTFLLLGEPPQSDNQTLQEELMQLNNQLSVLSRENVRKSRDLTKALVDLKKAQSMLVHQEKMASLGQMTAGIAHEINNPLAFVLGNEQVLRRDFDDVLVFINALVNALPEIASFSPRIHSEIVSKAKEVELEYLAEAVPRKIKANIEGLERIKGIVLDMRNFSRLDEAEWKYCQLTDGIESTLRLLGPLLQKHEVTVTTDFARLQPLFCSPGPLNQAISNLLANAIQASRPGQTVRILTRLDGDWYCVEVVDQGVGIPDENLAKVFDPFFTTKPVGSGTGLGMSIAHQVVEAHDGRIEIESKPDLGTTVRILLPDKKHGNAIGANKEKSYGT